MTRKDCLEKFSHINQKFSTLEQEKRWNDYRKDHPLPDKHCTNFYTNLSAEDKAKIVEWIGNNIWNYDMCSWCSMQLEEYEKNRVAYAWEKPG